jgi:hypothetical protein
MKKLILGLMSIIAVASCAGLSVSGQKTAARPGSAKSIVFAVLNDGALLEPIAYISNKKLSPPVNGSDGQSIIAAFNRTYYKPGAEYKLIFGGANAGTVTVKSSDAKADCSKNMAIAATRATKTPLKGLVMGLATNAQIKAGNGLRRRPTASEKDEIETLVRAEYLKEKLTPKELRYHNLTVIDVNGDGNFEFVGSYWVEIDKLTRGLLFFIGETEKGGKAKLGYREYRSIDQANVMSGEISAVDEGVYHELLLDSFDYDGDGTNEIFTYVQSFEGAGFHVYKRAGGKWARTYEFSNYHCAF